MESESFGKIVIFGPYKTGTTGLFYKVTTSLSGTIRCLFERMEYVAEPDDDQQWIVAKTILWYDEGDRQPKYESFFDFDRKIYLTRDPRDWLVSGTLFMIQEEPSLYNDDRKLNSILRALQQKQQRPESMSVLELLQLINDLSDRHTFEKTMEWMRLQYTWLPMFEKRLRECMLLKYEDFVDKRLAPLEEYLGFKLSGSGQVSAEHDHVPRTKGKGNWLDWFTDQDREIFQPIFSDYMARYGYADDWEPRPKPAISREHSIDYVIRTVNKRRTTPFIMPAS